MKRFHLRCYWFLLPLLLINISCKKEKQNIHSISGNGELYGSWTWTMSCGGIAGQSFTPATEGYTREIEFNRNGIYKLYQNGQLINQSGFNIVQGTSIYNGEIEELIQYDDNPILQSMTFYGNDSLSLNQNCYDCFQFSYVLKKR